MIPDDLEQRKRALERQLEEDLELVRAAYRVKLRALEALAGPVPSETRPVQPPREPGRVREDLAAAFAELPPVFDRADICQALGYEPSRTTLGRALDELLARNRIVHDRRSDGGHRARYRKVGEGA